MARAAGHFCPHGNLRYSCAKCRDERRAARGPVERKTYGRPLGPGGTLPKTPWRMDEVLAAHEQEAVKAAAEAQNGVVVLPAPLGLRRVAFALLRSLRHDVDGIIFIVPTPRAIEAWARALGDVLHVPGEEIDDQGRAVRDWNRLQTVTLWTPENALRNRSGLRTNAKRFALFVDSPESPAYSGLTDLFALPFARRLGVAAARLAPPPADAWPQLDALGGIIHNLDAGSAIRRGLLADLHWTTARVGGSGSPQDRARVIVDTIRSATRTGKALVWVDDSATGRAIEEAASREGLGARFVPGTATAELAGRAARAVQEGAARVLVVATDAPDASPGTVDVVVRAADGLAPARAAGLLIAHMTESGRRLQAVDLVPDAPDVDVIPALAARLHETALLKGAPLPQLPWLWRQLAIPVLPPWLRTKVTEVAADGWLAVQALVPHAVETGLDHTQANAALADAYIAHTFHLNDASLGPAAPLPETTEFPRWQTLPGLSFFEPAAQRAFAALLSRDLPACLAAYAGSPLLHHLVPDVRVLLLATAELFNRSRIPQLDPTDPFGAARLLVQRGPAFPGAETTTPDHDPVPPLSAELHLDRLTNAVDAERALDVEENVEEIQRLSAQERMRQGRTLLGLELVGKTRTDAGLELRYALPSRAGSPRLELPYTDATPGTLVDLSIGDRYDPVTRATVSGVDGYELRVVVEEDRERRAPGRDARLDIVGNPRVYEVLARGLRLVYGPGALTPASGADGVRDHLLQRAIPRPPAGVEGHFFNERLNASQQRAVARALGAHRLALVHGPPGTGKTTTLAEYILQEAIRGHRVLVVADSNAAVDAIMDACLSAGVPGVRTGPRPSLTRHSLAGLHLDSLSARAPGIDWLRRLPVVFTTHVSSASLPRELAFDVVVQDEASQATEAASCLSLMRAPRLVLAGDHLQLPPVVRSPEAERLGLGLSLFERLHRVYGTALGSLLSVQYRMHRDIEAWSNAAFYDGRIETAVEPPVMQAAVAQGLLPATSRALFVDVAGRETAARTSKERSAEAEWIDRFARRLLEAGVRPAQIAIIAAYRAQVRLLRRLLEGTGIDVGTIDAFQGSERDLVIVSLVRGNPRGEVGFVRDPRRLNVAMTRARRHLVVVGERQTLGQEPLLADLLATLTPHSWP